MTKQKTLPTAYRPCVGVMLLNQDNKVWVGRRMQIDKHDDEGGGMWWQMPQGGIDKGEDGETAALRELYEETGAKSATIIREASTTFKYDLPDHLIGVAWKGKFRGQEQRWFALRFTGPDSEIDISGLGHPAEFDEWRWADMSELADLIVPFKKDVYTKVVADFTDLAANTTT